MEKQYNHKVFETEIYNQWENSGSFQPKITKNSKPFCIILPPPNANADLHLGHAMYVVEDILVRFHRMLGDSALWLPGADHAGFETQYVYEKKLAKDGKSRFDFKRDTLYKNIWDFVHQNKTNMENQLKRLGFSLDWSREKFTLDPDIVNIVWDTFKKLYDDGLVYRGKRLVNYCTSCGTSFSDLETTHLEVDAKLWFIKYPVKDSQDFITIATTRPETCLGDVAVAVHPDDKRYKNLVGKTLVLPIINREIPIISDKAVDPKFGSGAVKITPAHDENDWNIGQHHKLKVLQIIGFDGKITQSEDNLVPDEFVGLYISKARKLILEKLVSLGLMEKETIHHTVLAKCYKCNATIQPLPLPQWFIKAKPLAAPAIEAVRLRRINIVPKRFEKVYFNWLNNIHDWNISRQVVWGIQIPAWQCAKCNKWTVTSGQKPNKCQHCTHLSLKQDSDTFDTWFSSGQWPFATLKTTKSGDFNYFYPTSVMDTMWDILFFWVARMIMLGIYKTGEIPFKTVYLHSRVTDAKGQKMSKSKGNVINPIEMIDKYGADALRLSLIFGTSAGTDLRMSEDKIRGFRNFTNKLWNIARFIKINEENIAPKKEKLQPEDQEMIKKLNILITKTTKDLESYNFSQSSQDLYQFVWHELADKYLENIKTRLANKDKAALWTLTEVFTTSLKLLHPLIPFITEILWQQLGNKEKLITSSWPKIKV